MIASYTNEIKDRFFDLEDKELFEIWEKIENTPEDETAERWKEKLEEIAREYSFSSRFALMRIIYSRAYDCDLGMADTENIFQIYGKEKTYTFSKLTIEHAEELSKEEIKQYRELLVEMAMDQADVDESVVSPLIDKALKFKKSSGLTREEALRLGHMLGFNLREMAWFLRRVFDYEDGFRFHVSNDLIEAYCFSAKESWKTAEEIKKIYREKTQRTEKEEEEYRSENWTQEIGDTLESLIEKWKINPETQEESFLQWLEEQRPYLDKPSRTTRAIYRNIAVYIYKISEEKIEIPDIPEFIKNIRNACSMNENDETRKCLWQGEKISDETCKKISDSILEKNKKLYTSASNRVKAWRTVTATRTGIPKLMVMAGKPDADKNRISDLLRGECQVEKGDMLHLLWYGFCLCWLKNPIREKDSSLFYNIADFIETAEDVLEAALLPEFYPPHLMERSMLMSMVVSSMDGTGEPAFAYAELCESLIKKK